MSNMREDRSERLCSRCQQWRPFTREFWYIAPKGYASRGECKVCMYPNGKGRPGPKAGTKLVNAPHRNKLIAKAAAKVYRIDEIRLDPHAAVAFAQSIGLDPAKIAAWFYEETVCDEFVSTL